MAKLLFDKYTISCENFKFYDELVESIERRFQIQANEFYLLQNGKRLSSKTHQLSPDEGDIHLCLRLNGGKGGFGSMLRAIGAQIEKTTNREACRDLSGRRLRDINEEKRLKAWLEKQVDREREAEERKKRKIEKLLAEPKLDFKDKEYEEARSKLTEKVNDAVEEGYKKAQKLNDDKPGPSTLKRKTETANSTSSSGPLKKNKASLWIGDDISDCDTDSSDEEEKAEKLKLKKKN